MKALIKIAYTIRREKTFSFTRIDYTFDATLIKLLCGDILLERSREEFKRWHIFIDHEC